MYLAAALAAHNVLVPRHIPVAGPSASLPSAATNATFMEGSAIDSDDDLSTPSLTSAASFCSSLSSSSLDAHHNPTEQSTPSCTILTPVPISYESRLATTNIRKNEHLAVLLPKSLWKPDSQATCCEIVMCHRKFTLLERKHHCRKCGGVFCSACSSRTTALLDTTNLDFLHPPRRVPISNFESPQSPVMQARVCDDCYIQIYGLDEVEEASEYVKARRDSRPSSPAIPSTPSSCRSMRRADSSMSVPPRQRRNRTTSETHSTAPSIVSVSSQSSLGDLEYYPLRVHSSVCKVMGGGRWSPKPVRQWDGHRIPGGKAPFEVAMDRAAEKERLRKLNPVIRDGDIQLRLPRAPERVDRWKPIEVLTH